MKKALSVIFLLLSIICGFTWLSAQPKTACIDSLSYKVVQSRWNKNVKALKTGSWKLFASVNSNFKGDTILVAQALDGPSLYFTATVLKNGCVKRVAIKAKRDMDIAYASMVAWLTVVKVFNPELSATDRKKVLEDLGIMEKGILLNTSIERGNNKYFFEETFDGNVFTVLTRN